MALKKREGLLRIYAGRASISETVFTGKMPGMYILWVMPAFTLAGHLAGRFSSVEIVRLGFSISLGLQLFFIFMTVLLMRSSAAKYMRYAILNVIFNYIVFSAFGPPLLQFIVS